MDLTSVQERDIVVDIETCVNSSKEAVSLEILDGQLEKVVSFTVCGMPMAVDELADGEISVSLPINVKNVSEISSDLGKSAKKDSRKSTSAKKPPKPPRPPRSSLDAADQNLIKEMAKLAMIKRARIERMKVLKKMKAAKASSSASASSSANLVALFFIVLFCIVIIFKVRWNWCLVQISRMMKRVSRAKISKLFPVLLSKNFSRNQNKLDPLCLVQW